jgi:hypothetical protein
MVATTLDGSVPDPVKAAWQQAVDGWDDAARHDALFQLAAQHNCYAWVASRYRGILRDRPGDAVAERELARLRKATEAVLMASASLRPDKATTPYRNTIAVLGLLVVVIAMGLVYALVFYEGHSDTPAPATTPHRP